jgi:hypothetical protein
MTTIVRRRFIFALGSATVAWTSAVPAQQTTVPIVGFLQPGKQYPFGVPDVDRMLTATSVNCDELRRAVASAGCAAVA